MRRPRLALAALVLVAAPAAAHGGAEGEGALLDASGEALLLGRYDAPQPGPLVVAPFRDGPLPCGEPADAGYRVALGGGAGLALLGNATHVAAVLDLPRPGFAAVAFDTNAAARTLLLMQEQAVALHRLAAALPNGSAWDARGGVLGLPYALPGAGAHDLGAFPEEQGPRLAYDRDAAPEAACAGAPGHLTLMLRRDALASLAPGGVVHVVALWDPDAPGWLPRPLPSTHALQANAYLARPGEDAAQVRAALAARPGPAEAVPLLALGAGVAALVLATGRR